MGLGNSLANGLGNGFWKWVKEIGLGMVWEIGFRNVLGKQVKEMVWKIGLVSSLGDGLENGFGKWFEKMGWEWVWKMGL